MEILEIGGVQCAQSLKSNAEYLLIQPCDTEEFAELDSELTLLGDETPFSFAAFAVADWNRDLSPWAAPPVFGKEPFGGGGEAHASGWKLSCCRDFRGSARFSAGTRLQACSASGAPFNQTPTKGLPPLRRPSGFPAGHSTRKSRASKPGASISVSVIGKTVQKTRCFVQSGMQSDSLIRSWSSRESSIAWNGTQAPILSIPPDAPPRRFAGF